MVSHFIPPYGQESLMGLQFHGHPWIKRCRILKGKITIMVGPYNSSLVRLLQGNICHLDVVELYGHG